MQKITDFCPNCGDKLTEKLNTNQLRLDIHLKEMCPICGNQYITLPLSSNKPNRIILDDGSSITEYFCDACGSWVSPYKLRYHFVFYSEYSLIYGGSANDAMIRELKENPLFDKDKYLERATKECSISANSNQTETRNKPKCPTCGSANIEKISTTSKVVGATMFGLLSKTARSQFKCKNCGYKW